MLKFFSRILAKASKLFFWLSKKIYTPIQEKRVKNWYKDQGTHPFYKDNDKNHRYLYDLNEDSLVFDIGGYKGQWASDIFSMYCCRIHIFEPVKKFADRIEERFKYNNKIKVFKFGLGNKNETVPIMVDADASSVFKREGERENILIYDIMEIIHENEIEEIDLLKINIEGGEYTVLERLIQSGFIKQIKNIQVQFHDFVENAKEKKDSIQKKLSKTHYLTYEYPWVWENWQLL